VFLAPLAEVAGRIIDRDGVLEPLDDRCRYRTWVDS